MLPAPAEAQNKTSLTPEQALARLKKGNLDFLADKAEVSPQDHNRRLEIARGQAPFAVRRTFDRLRNSEPSLIEPLRAGTLKIVGARYDLDDGKVDFLME